MRSWVPAPWIGRVPVRPFWIGAAGEGGWPSRPGRRPARRGSLDGQPPLPQGSLGKDGPGTLKAGMHA
jgi:hypothetical protein